MSTRSGTLGGKEPRNIDKKRKLSVYKSELLEPYTTDNGGEARNSSRARKLNDGDRRQVSSILIRRDFRIKAVKKIEKIIQQMLPRYNVRKKRDHLEVEADILS